MGSSAKNAILCFANKDSEISLAHRREKRERDEPYKPQVISKGMTSQRGLRRARGHTAKKDLAAEEVLLGQQRLDPIACPRKTHYNQGLGKRNQGKVTGWRPRTVADYMFFGQSMLNVSFGGNQEWNRPTGLQRGQILPGHRVSVEIWASLIQKCYVIFYRILKVIISPFIF